MDVLHRFYYSPFCLIIKLILFTFTILFGIRATARPYKSNSENFIGLKNHESCIMNHALKI